MEVDRLGSDEGATLEPDEPVEYDRDELDGDIDYLAQFPQAEVASEIGMSERRWRDIVKGVSQPRGATAERIRVLAAKRRLDRA